MSSMGGCCALGLIGALLLWAAPAWANDSAHQLAERFAGAGETASDTREAGETAAQEAPQQAARRAFAAQGRRAGEERRRAEAKSARDEGRAAAQRRSDEADMLARARREADEMRSKEEEARLAEDARRLVEEAEKARSRAEALFAGGEAPAGSPDGRPALARGAAQSGDDRDGEGVPLAAEAALQEELARQRRQEIEQLTEKLKRVRQIRQARLAAQAAQASAPAPPGSPPQPQPVAAAAPAATAPGRAALAEDEARAGALAAAGAGRAPERAAAPAAARPNAGGPTAQVARRDAPARGLEPRVSVLLRMEPGSYGIRRKGPKIADPVLCTLAGCYIGMGAAAPAHFLPGHMALGIANTFGGRAGACRQSLGCVFRGVELGHVPFYLQPVDLHILKHDRRRGQVLTEDSDCAAEAGRLHCSRGIYAEDYAMWIVPESIAAAAGPEALERALASGLNGPRSAALTPPMTAY